jgi:hypothetical protein
MIMATSEILEFYVQPVATNNSKKKFLPLYEVSIHFKNNPVYTVHGERGVATTVTIKFGYWAYTGFSVCVPKDNFDWRYGAKLALTNALAQASAISREDSKNIWIAFFDCVFPRQMPDILLEQLDEWRMSPILKPKGRK